MVGLSGKYFQQLNSEKSVLDLYGYVKHDEIFVNRVFMSCGYFRFLYDDF